MFTEDELYRIDLAVGGLGKRCEGWGRGRGLGKRRESWGRGGRAGEEEGGLITWVGDGPDTAGSWRRG